MSRSTLEAIQRGLKTSQEGKSRAVKKLYSSLVTPHKIVRSFNVAHKEKGYGEPLPLSKKTLGMVSGFIKLGKSNGWEDRRFYEIVKDVVYYWDQLKGLSLTTLNNKKMVLSGRPSLLEFLIGRDSIMHAISDLEARQKSMIDSRREEHTSVQVTNRVESGPTEDEAKAEYEREMEKQIEDYY